MPHCFKFPAQFARFADSRAREITGKSKAANIVMMAITTKSSINEKPMGRGMDCWVFCVYKISILNKAIPLNRLITNKQDSIFLICVLISIRRLRDEHLPIFIGSHPNIFWRYGLFRCTLLVG